MAPVHRDEIGVGPGDAFYGPPYSSPPYPIRRLYGDRAGRERPREGGYERSALRGAIFLSWIVEEAEIGFGGVHVLSTPQNTGMVVGRSPSTLLR